MEFLFYFKTSEGVYAMYLMRACYIQQSEELTWWQTWLFHLLNMNARIALQCWICYRRFTQTMLIVLVCALLVHIWITVLFDFYIWAPISHCSLCNREIKTLTDYFLVDFLWVSVSHYIITMLNIPLTRLTQAISIVLASVHCCFNDITMLCWFWRCQYRYR